MLRNREAKQHKVDTVEKEVDSPVEVMCKKVGKKDKKSKKRVSFAAGKTNEEEHQELQVQSTKAKIEHIIPLHHVLLFDFVWFLCVF